MIKAYPLRELVTCYKFKDSGGERHELQPAETLADVGVTPQEFDGNDPIVAELILGQLKLNPPTVMVSKEDVKILKAALKAKPKSDAEAPKGDADDAVADAEFEMDKAVQALADSESAHADALKVAEEAKEVAVADALTEAKAISDKALEETADVAAQALAKAVTDVTDDAATRHASEIETLNKAHEKAVAAIQKDLEKALKKVPK